MKTVCVINRNSVIPDLSDRFDVVGENGFASADAFVLWQDAVGEERAIAAEALGLEKPVFVLQHGWCADGYTEYKENASEWIGSKLLVWSDWHRKLYESEGVPPEQIAVIGCPLYHDLEAHTNDRETVVFAPTHLEKDLEANERNLAEAVKAWSVIERIPNIRPIAKLIAGETLSSPYGEHGVTSSLQSDNHIRSVVKVLKNAACAVVQDEGTFAFLAYAMGVPVIKLANRYPAHTSAPMVCDISDLPSTINACIEFPGINHRERVEARDMVGGDPAKYDAKAALVQLVNNALAAPCV